jgi:hypothetical protein
MLFLHKLVCSISYHAQEWKGGIRTAPIILVSTDGDSILPTIEWSTSSTHGISDRLQNKLIGKHNGAAPKRTFKIVGDNDGLDISGEYGRLDIAV